MMHKYPFVRQRDLKDCGVCCLSMIIQYYKGYVPLEKLRDMTHTTRDGVSAFNLKRAGQELGLEVKGLKINDFKNISLPCIAHVTVSKSFDHYVVVYKVDYEKEQIVIADPARGIIKMKIQEFNKIFNNVILEYIFKGKIPVYSKSLSFSKFILNIIKEYKKQFITVLIFSLFITLFSIITSFYIEIIFTELQQNLNNLLFKTFILFSILYVLKNILDYFRNKIFLVIHRNIDFKLTNNIFMKIITLPYEYFKNRTTGEVVSRINDLSIVSSVIVKLIVSTIIDGLLMIVSGITLFFINRLLFLISFIIYFIYVMCLLYFNKHIIKKITILKEKKSILNSYTYECIKNFETIKGLSIENNIKDKFYNLNNLYTNQSKKLDTLFNMELVLKNVIFDIGICIIIFTGSLLSVKGYINNSNLISFYFLVFFFFTPILNIIDIFKEIKDAIISYERVSELFISTKDKNRYINIPFNNIKYHNLNYKYHNSIDALKNVNLEIEKNNKIMICGMSGSGKTTLLKLLKKYYLVDDGHLFINNIDINKIPIKMLSDNITYVSQSENLFTDTLYNNLCLNRRIPLNELKKVINLCDINFINYNYYIEEDGFNLSGGQRQRIILARSLLNKFNILILDEVFNEMDVNLERKILKRLFDKYRKKIIIVVSHRNNNMDLFDKVINIDNTKNIQLLERK